MPIIRVLHPMSRALTVQIFQSFRSSLFRNAGRWLSSGCGSILSSKLYFESSGTTSELLTLRRNFSFSGDGAQCLSTSHPSSSKPHISWCCSKTSEENHSIRIRVSFLRFWRNCRKSSSLNSVFAISLPIDDWLWSV